MPDVFLSYSRRNLDLALQVYDALSAAGVDVWFDQRSVADGQSWLDANQDGLNAVHTFLVLIADDAPSSWVKAEGGAALRRYYGGAGEFRILPLIVVAEGRTPRSAGLLLDAFQRVSLPATAGQIDPAALAELVKPVKDRSADVRDRRPVMDEPFRGLRYYRAEDQHLFFGREAETAELLRRLQQHRWLQVESVSGAGKSSLLRAGRCPPWPADCATATTAIGCCWTCAPAPIRSSNWPRR